MNRRSRRLLVAAVAGAALLPGFAQAANVSPPVILQYFESSWKTMQKRTPDVFMAGYGALWTPPPGRALYDDQGGGIGYNLYDRFDLGKAGDPTLYGTENQYRALIKGMQRTNGSVYVDYVHHHVGSWDVPGYNGWDAYVPQAWQHVQDRSDYPGFELSDPYVGANSFNSNYRNLTGHRDSYPDAPPVNDGNTSQYQYQYRLAHLITIDLTSGRSFVRNPVPGDPNNIRQAPNAYAIATSTMLPNGHPGNSTVVRQANTPTNDNKRFYPDTSLPGMTVTDPANGGGSYTIYPYNLANPSAGDPSSETNVGYMQRYAQWLVNDIGVDGLRIDAARHVPFGQQPDAYNPSDLDVPALVDRAVYRQSRRTNLDGTQRSVFSFQEVFSGDQNLLQTFTRKDINPGTPNVVGGNRDVLDFPMWFAMRSNLTSNGLANNWYNIRNASQDNHDDGNANNGSQSIGFVVNHDDGKGPGGSDFIYLDNVAHAWILTRPGNAYVYFNSHEFDRTGNTEFFLKDGRGDALGGQYGNIVTKLVDIRNSYGRGDFQERWIDGGGTSNLYVFERKGSMIIGLNSALGQVTNYDQRGTMNSSFPAGTHLEEQTGNALDPSVDPLGEIPDTITIGAGGTLTMRIPRNQTTGSGTPHGKGYVIYGLPRPQGSVAVSNVASTIASESGNNATSRINAVDVITSNSFNITLNTNKRTLSDGFHDIHADGDAAYVRIDEGMNLNGNAGVDFTTQGDTRYGFENFVTLNDPGYNASEPLSGAGQYVQSVDATQLSEGYHYITARAFRHKIGFTDEQDVFTDFKKVVYIDRFPAATGAEWSHANRQRRWPDAQRARSIGRPDRRQRAHSSRHGRGPDRCADPRAGKLRQQGHAGRRRSLRSQHDRHQRHARHDHRHVRAERKLLDRPRHRRGRLRRQWPGLRRHQRRRPRQRLGRQPDPQRAREQWPDVRRGRRSELGWRDYPRRRVPARAAPHRAGRQPDHRERLQQYDQQLRRDPGRDVHRRCEPFRLYHHGRGHQRPSRKYTRRPLHPRQRQFARNPEQRDGEHPTQGEQRYEQHRLDAFVDGHREAQPLRH